MKNEALALPEFYRDQLLEDCIPFSDEGDLLGPGKRRIHHLGGPAGQELQRRQIRLVSGAEGCGRFPRLCNRYGARENGWRRPGWKRISWKNTV